MKKLFAFLKNMAFVYLIINILLLFVTVIVQRRIGIIIPIPFVKITVAFIVISFFIALAIEIFKYDKLHTAVRIILGYFILFYTTILIRRTFGPWLFRTSFVVLLFVLFCTIIYFLGLLIYILLNKKEEKEMNEALKNFDIEG